jgi:hypothetical protein
MVLRHNTNRGEMKHVPVYKDDHKNQIDDSWHDRDSLVR